MTAATGSYVAIGGRGFACDSFPVSVGSRPLFEPAGQVLVETVSPVAVAGRPRRAQRSALVSAGGTGVETHLILVVDSRLAFESGADTASVCSKCVMEVAESFAGLSASLASVAGVPAVASSVGLQGVCESENQGYLQGVCGSENQGYIATVHKTPSVQEAAYLHVI